CAPDGRVWLTAPVGTTGAAAGSRVCADDPDTGQVSVAIDEVAFPNGLAFGVDPADLYVADSETGDILRYRVGDGPPYRREVFARDPGSGPDGIAFDADGYLYVAAFELDQVVVWDPAGRLVRRISTGEGSRPTNLCFAGPDPDRLVVTLARGGRGSVAAERFAGRPPSPWLARHQRALGPALRPLDLAFFISVQLLGVLSALPPVPERELLDLARGGLRVTVHEEPGRGHLVTRQRRPQLVAQVGGGDLRSRRPLDEGGHDLAVVVVGQPHHRGAVYAVLGEQPVFDLARVDVLAAPDDH